MKTLIAAVAFATVLVAPAFAQTENAWGWKGASAAPASAKSAYAGAFNAPRGAFARHSTRDRGFGVSPASPLAGDTGW